MTKPLSKEAHCIYGYQAISSWLSDKPRKRGRPEKYSNIAIETVLTLKAILKFDNRKTEGLIKSIFEMLKLDLPAPDHTTISRRGRKLNIQLPKTNSKNIHLVIDSTGIKLYGDGEWKAYKHGREKKTKWIKIHIGVDA